jgi:hypothetical protein
LCGLFRPFGAGAADDFENRKKEITMKALLLFTVLAVASLGTSRAVWATNYNVSLTDSVTTWDSTGSGSFDSSQFTCDTDPSNFFCTEGSFTCYGWSNCDALGATDNAPNLTAFLSALDGNGDSTDPPAPASTPEPAPLILVGSGLVILLSAQRRIVR